MFFLNIFLVCLIGYHYFPSFQLSNEPGLDSGNDPGGALKPFPPNIG